MVRPIRGLIRISTSSPRPISKDGSAQVAGTSLSPANLANTQWKIRGAADFDADGMTDLLWQNTVTGELAVWFMNGSAQRTSGVPIPGVVGDTGWRIVGPK